VSEVATTDILYAQLERARATTGKAAARCLEFADYLIRDGTPTAVPSPGALRLEKAFADADICVVQGLVAEEPFASVGVLPAIYEISSFVRRLE